jgi:hypothetical protein
MDISRIDINNISDEDLELIYIYLDLQFNSMSEKDQLTWINIMKLIDKEFKNYVDNYNSGL